MVHSVSGWTRGVQVKLWDPLRTRAIPERLRRVITTRRYTNPRLPYLYLKFINPNNFTVYNFTCVLYCLWQLDRCCRYASVMLTLHQWLTSSEIWRFLTFCRQLKLENTFLSFVTLLSFLCNFFATTNLFDDDNDDDDDDMLLIRFSLSENTVLQCW